MFNSPRAAFMGGVQAVAPILVGAMPFGLVVGVICAEVGLSGLQAIVMSMFVFAGVSQLIALSLLDADAILWVIVLSAAMVNLRHVIYSASLADHFKALSVRWKLLISYLLVDQTYALGIAHYDKYPDELYKQWYYFGVGTLLWVGWMGAIVIGFFVGAVIPSGWSLNFIIPLMFIALIVPAIKGFPYLAAGVVGSTIAVVGVNLPHNLGLVTAILCGIITGAILEREQ